jgi:nucleoside-diphosphate-sugar epimerase
VEITRRLLKKHDQIVIFGAKGWIGRSAIDVIFKEYLYQDPRRIVFIGSKTEFAREANLPLNIYSSNDARKIIGNEILFLNSAYLRREKLSEMDLEEYEKRNFEIVSFGLELIKAGKVKTFINFSSGIVSQITNKDYQIIEDPYARSKLRDEVLFTKACQLMQTQMVNCRIYNISGKYVNEFANLALTSFIAQAKGALRAIKVQSPTTLRTYVDAIDLIKVILELSLMENNFDLDSGGELISLGNLAKAISCIESGSTVSIPISFKKSPDYFGDYLKFNELAKKSGIRLKNIKEQIVETSKAFNSANK